MYDFAYMRQLTAEPIYKNLPDIEVKDKLGFISYQGKISNMRFNQDSYGVVLAGSLCKLLHGDNLHAFTMHDTKACIELLSDTLSLQVANSQIFSLEIAANLKMEEPISYYLYPMGNLRYFKNMNVGNASRCYFNQTKSVKFYDKVKELGKTNKELSAEYQGLNILRYELKIKKRLKHFFDMSDVFARDLYRDEFYNKAVQAWKEFYFKIEKRKKIKFQGDVMDIKSFVNQLAVAGIQSIGQSEVESMIEQRRGQVSDRNYFRMKQKFKELITADDLTEESQAMKELDRKILAVES